jgi:hypothetical protein
MARTSSEICEAALRIVSCNSAGAFQRT